ncbi:DUF916 domain-containing protein [Patescibacteria group bacterium]|nr:DUF916 domain-containing protein [Patescibacteria group bacterium]
MKLFSLRSALFSLIGVSGLFGLLFFHTPIVRAITVSPVIVDLEIDPGKSTQGSLHITNSTEKTATYYLNVQNFVAQGEEGHQDFLPEGELFGLASWITPETESVTLEPNESGDFRYVVNVPQDAEPGGHYAAVFFSTRPASAEEGSSVGVGAKTGILFLLRVAGDIIEDARVESFTTTGGWHNRLPVYLTLRVKNLGNVHIRPEGDIIVRSMFGSIADKIPANSRRAAVLPDSIRRVEAAWAKTFDMEQGGFFTELKNEWNNFALGRYTAELDARYGVTKQPLSAQVTFWVIPWRVLSIVVLLLVVLLFLLKGYNKMVVRSALKQHTPKNK